MTPPSLAPVPGEPPRHPTDDLPALVAGELGLDRVGAVTAHLRTCAACRAELVEVVAGFGALHRIERTGLTEPETPPPLRVAPDEEPAAPSVVGTGATVTALPGRRSRRTPLLVAAAAAVVVVLAGVVALVRDRTQGGTGEVRVALAPEGGSSGSGYVEMDDAGPSSVMTVSTSSLPAPPQGSFYEVWLFDPDSGQMLPVGVLPHDKGTATYTLPDDLVGRYKAVDISVQPDNGSMVHSNESVLRGSYA